MRPESEKGGLSRREFLLASGATAGALVLGFWLAPRWRAPSEVSDRVVNSWITVGADESVTIFVSKAEMGQGIHTAMAMLVAEELEVDWERVRVAPSPLSPEFFLGDIPVTSGSRSVRFAYEPLRQVGAVAREMFVSAAAARWGIAREQCVARNGHVERKSDGSLLSYGQLAPAAARLAPPPVPPLKAEKDCRFLGKAVKRIEGPAKVNGSLLYGIDVAVPGMLVAAVRRLGAPTNFEEIRRSAPAGVEFVEIEGAVAAVSESYWQSQAALDALLLPQSGSGESSESIRAALWKRLERSGPEDVVEKRGGSVVGAVRQLHADYEVPYLAHATMEPPACVASVKGDRCELWAGTKSAVYTRTAVAKFLNLPHENVTVHAHVMGGSYGRKGESDFTLQAVALSRQLGRPVKVIWSREEDLRYDFYRPAAVARLEATLGAGKITSWNAANVVASSVPSEHVDVEHLNSVRDASFAGLPYSIPRITVKSAVLPASVPVGFWRSTASSHNAFFVESFLDEIAHATRRDPLDLRLELLAESPEKAAVLREAARLAGWGRGLPRGHGLGLAFEENKGTRAALVAEVERSGNGFRVRHLYCAFDCGPVVNASGVEAQLQGGLVFGLSACLYGRISVQGGQVQQSNFHDYRVLSMAECPPITISRVVGKKSVGGIGEAAVPLVAPAVANALFRAGGGRVRRLPFFPPRA